MTNSNHIDENLGKDNKFQAWKYRISLVIEENELDTYISGEVLVLEGDESIALHKKNLVKAKRITLYHKCLP